jgi:glutathione peroxidase-family protein/cyclophilin family peptidyl-prolyl cis-trans isomerase
MRKIPALLALLLLSVAALRAQSLYDVPLKDIDGKPASLAPYKGRALLVVNTASECGYTPQYAGLEALFLKYKPRGLTVVGFPCNQFGGQEPGTAAVIKKFCTDTYNVTFPLFDKIEVNGPQRHPLYALLAGPSSPFPGDITWNFNKFLVGPDGKILARFDSAVTPDSPDLIKAVEAALVTTSAGGGAAAAASAAAADNQPPGLADIRVILHTSKGDIAGTLYASKAPATVANFLNLSAKGFYNGLTFHRVIPNFMIQGGDPRGNGTGGPGYDFGDETRKDLKFDHPGVFAMANSDQGKVAYSNTGHTNGSQFFITHVETSWLNGMHTIFGAVTKGQDVVNQIAGGDKIVSIEILDSTDALFKAQAANLDKWNAMLKK